MISIDELRAFGTVPEFFGLGMVQLKAEQYIRYHFWDTELPTPEGVGEEYHDHRYSFISDVLLGSITNNLVYPRDDPDGVFGQYQVCCAGGGAEFVSMVEPISVGTFVTHAGGRYWVSRDAYHRTVIADRYCITRQHREPTAPAEKANVLSKSLATGMFDNPYTESQLWEIIDSILPRQGYHVNPIPKGVLGQASKIVEEVMELQDAEQQGCRIMQLVELSDAVGAIEAYLEANHAGYKLADLLDMAKITKRAFQSGSRT